MAKIKVPVVALILGTIVLASPFVLFAGGNFQSKISQKISAGSKNIQYGVRESDEQYVDYSEQYSPAQSNEKRININKEKVTKPNARDEAYSLQTINPTPTISPYAIYKVEYKAEIEEDVATVKGNVIFEVFRKGWVQIPLTKSNVGLIDVRVNRGAAFVTMQGTQYYIMVDKPGRYTLDIEFLIKAARERENGPGSFTFESIPAPICQFEFTMPEQNVEIFVDPSIRLEVKREQKKTVAWAVMPNTNTINVRWTKALPKETITPVKLEPKVYVDTATYASIGEGIIRCQTRLNYSILQSEVSNFRIALPTDISVLEVKGNDLRDWKVSQDKDTQHLDVYLNFGIKGNYILDFSYERKISEGSGVAQIPWVKTIGVEREKGYFGIAASTNVELAVNKIEHINLIDVKELPPQILSSTPNPILLAFKYLTHPFSIAIDVTKHEELPVLIAAIDSVEYVSLQTDEGKNLTKAVYQVRNNVKQFIRLSLPKDATLWSVFVAGKPVKPAKDKNASILIPLEKSQLSGEDLTQFPVEIVYLEKTHKMGLVGGWLKLNLPKTDIPISSLIWSVYLPLDYAYFNFGGDVKMVRDRFGSLQKLVSLKRSVQEKYDRFKTSQSANQSQEYFSEQVSPVQMKGVLPIKVEVPEQGRLYRFSKLLVTENESPRLSVSFITVFRPIHGFIRFLIFVTVIFYIVRFIKKNQARKKKNNTA
ncbi:MAG: hypothetical protein Q8O30_12830 [Candidatus Omnitrophota bacterium]|nr:hypothetical protein [Candidatus Omnitrophota bacterium]